MGTVDGRGYDGQLKYTICDACRPCHSNLSTLKPVFRRNQHFRRAYNSLRCLDVEIRRFLCPRRQQRQWRQNRSLHPCTCARGNNARALPNYKFQLHLHLYSHNDKWAFRSPFANTDWESFAKFNACQSFPLYSIQIPNQPVAVNSKHKQEEACPC